jgi:hypothetical protein
VFLLLAALTAACASTPAPPSAAPAPDPLAQCRTAAVDLSLGLARRQGELRSYRQEQAFREGQPQPGAERALAPLLAELARLYGPVRSQTLECRTWMCKFTFTVVEQPHAEGVVSEELRYRVGGSVMTDRHDIDPSTGAKLVITTFYLSLRHPAGERRTDEQLREEALSSTPTTLDGCQARLAELRAADERSRAEEAPHKPAMAFASEKPSPALTADTARLLVEAFGLPPQPADKVVDCRQTICKLLVPVDQQRVRKLRAGALGPRYQWTAGPGATPDETVVYLWWESQRIANSLQLVREAFRAADAARSKCAGLAPGRGGLTVHVELPASDGAGTAPKATLTVEGSLSGTALGRCMVGLVDEKLRASSVRGPFSGSSRNYDYLFPGR